MDVIQGTINTPRGFTCSGVHVGIKRKRKDLALIFSDRPTVMAGMFTTNRVKAACVTRNQEILSGAKPIRALIVNSGVANACTGHQGIANNRALSQWVAEALEVHEGEVVTASTGVIGVQLPMGLLQSGIRPLVEGLSSDWESGLATSEAIMTTDTTTKMASVQVQIDGQTVTIAGIAKGSGMIHPNMATMLSFVTTDAVIDQPLLQQALQEIGQATYNMISVDGDTSTNDMVLTLANGAAEHAPLEPGSRGFQVFCDGLHYVHEDLAKQIVRDGEGASKFVEVHVGGAASVTDARALVKSILTSNLVKTALFGEDANWGRILCAMGYSGAAFDPERASLEFSHGPDTIQVLEEGSPVPFDEERALELLRHHDIGIHVVLQDGSEQAVGWGCDLSYEYVKINGEYRS